MLRTLNKCAYEPDTFPWQVNTGSALALRYNDVSVLENMHAASAFDVIERTSVLAGMDRVEYKAARKLIVAAILATDVRACGLVRACVRAWH